MGSSIKWVVVASAIAGAAAALAGQHLVTHGGAAAGPLARASAEAGRAGEEEAAARQPWTRQGFRDEESWHEAGSPDTNEGANFQPAQRRR